ncbi:MAG TPA: AtpZ/AtpI family protein [Geobacteraceae bacterium]|nr:AtpZ/AtpI family protein [Geobacteraceae bacterium]
MATGKEKSKEKRELLQTLGTLSTVGISVVVAIAIGVYVGRKLDEWLGTAPWFFFIFLFFGIVAGYRNIFIMTKKEIRRDDTDSDN